MVGRRPLVELARCADLADSSGFHDGDAVGQGKGLALVVGHQDRGDSQIVQQQRQLDLHLLAQVAVEGAEGLVEQQHLRPDGQRAGDGHALALAAAQLSGITAQQAVELQQRRYLADAGSNGRPVQPPGAQAVVDIVGHRHVREQGIALEHHGDVAAMRRDIVQRDTPQADGAIVDRFEARDHVQQRRLSAAARPQQRQDLALLQGKAEPLEGNDVAKALGDAVDLEVEPRAGSGQVQLWTSRV